MPSMPFVSYLRNNVKNGYILIKIACEEMHINGDGAPSVNFFALVVPISIELTDCILTSVQ